MARIRRTWVLKGSIATSYKGNEKEAEIDLISLFPNWSNLNVGQQSAIFYGVKQIVMDRPNFTFVETYKDLINGKLNKLLRKKTSTKIDVMPLVNAYRNATNDNDKAMYKAALDTLGLVVE